MDNCIESQKIELNELCRALLGCDEKMSEIPPEIYTKALHGLAHAINQDKDILGYLKSSFSNAKKNRP
ncbi:hypothetical protein ACFL35_14130 [Candidatus Riflebacteria bacterium]